MVELYHKMACPFSKKVRDYIDQENLHDQVAYKDTVKDHTAKAELMEITGRTQVPCLVVDGEPILESDDIIDWLDSNVANRK